MSDVLHSELKFQGWADSAENGDFEQSMAAIDEIVAVLDQGHLRMDDLVECYELGSRLLRRCDLLLNQAQIRISRIESQLISDDLE